MRFEGSRSNWLLIAGLLALGCLPTTATLSAQTQGVEQKYFVNAELPWHKAVLDSQGRILAWYHPEKNLGYDEFMHLDWDFLEHKVPIDHHTGVKVYLTHSIYDPDTLQGINWQHVPATTFAHQTDAMLRWYPYSGDEESIRVIREMLDYHLAHGMTPANWKWAGVPFTTNCQDDKDYGHCIEDMPKQFYGGLETDKIGELGLSYVQVYEMTGEQKYLDQGLKCAEQLAKYIRPGDAWHTPWPYRIDAQTGDVLDGEEYGGMIVGPVRLFDELIKLGVGDTASFKKARDMAWKWVQDNPLNLNSAAWDKWSGYYEDVPKDTINVNDMTSIMTAYYILSHDDPSTVDPTWLVHVGHLIDRSRALLGRGPFFGAWAIDEQMRPDGGILNASSVDTEFIPHGNALMGTDNRGCCSRSGLVCRTSQWGALNAMLYDKTGDGAAYENAFRSLNYATYFAGSDGRISCCGPGIAGDYWFEDGYSDAGRSFMWAMAAVPDFAPVGQDHLLGSSSIIQKVKYAPRRVEYRTFDKSGTETLRLSFLPAKVTAASSALSKRDDLKGEGYTVQPLGGGDYEVKVNHANSNDVAIDGAR
jgi:hypothetical protein